MQNASNRTSYVKLHEAASKTVEKGEDSGLGCHEDVMKGAVMFQWSVLWGDFLVGQLFDLCR